MSTSGRNFWMCVAMTACGLAVFCLWWTARAQVYQEQMQQVLQQSPSAIVVCNNSGKVIFANERLFTYTGFTQKDLQEQGLATIIPKELYPKHVQSFTRLAATHPTTSGLQYRKVVPVRCADGKFFCAVISVSTVVNAHRGYDFYAFITPLPAESEIPAMLDADDFKQPPLPSKAPATQAATGALAGAQ